MSAEEAATQPPTATTATAPSSSSAGQRLTIPAPLPPLPAAWLAGRDRDLLAPLTLATLGAALPPPPRVEIGRAHV